MTNLGFIHSVAAIGGAERVTEALIKNLPKKGFQSRLFTPEPGAFSDSVQEYGANCSSFKQEQPSWRAPLKTLKGYQRWRNATKKYEIDIFHAADLHCARSALVIGKKTPLLCHIHFPFSRDYAAWVFKGLPKPKAFVFCSQELKDAVGPYLEEICPTSMQKVIHNGIDPEKFKMPPPNNEIKHIGIIANLQKRKGHDDFLQMAKAVLSKHENVQFDIIGGDILQEPREEHLKALACDLGISNKVTFHGQLNDVKKALQTLDIYVCASHQEAFPISNLEAMAAAKAIVSTDVNGIPEAIENNVHGLLIPKGQPEQMADKVCYLLEHPDKAMMLGENARKHVEKNFSEAVFTRKFEAIYSELLEDK